MPRRRTDGRASLFASHVVCAGVGAGALSRLPAPVTPPAPPPWETLFNWSSPSAAAASVVYRQAWPSAVPVCIWKLRPVAHVGLSLSNTWQLAALLLLLFTHGDCICALSSEQFCTTVLYLHRFNDVCRRFCVPFLWRLTWAPSTQSTYTRWGNWSRLKFPRADSGRATRHPRMQMDVIVAEEANLILAQLE